MQGQFVTVNVVGDETVHVCPLVLNVVGVLIAVQKLVTTVSLGVPGGVGPTFPASRDSEGPMLDSILSEAEPDPFVPLYGVDGTELVNVQGQFVTVSVVGEETVHVCPFVLKVVGVVIAVLKLDTTVSVGPLTGVGPTLVAFHNLEDSVLDSKISVVGIAVWKFDTTVSVGTLTGVGPTFVAFHNFEDPMLDSILSEAEPDPFVPL